MAGQNAGPGTAVTGVLPEEANSKEKTLVMADPVREIPLIGGDSDFCVKPVPNHVSSLTWLPWQPKMCAAVANADSLIGQTISHCRIRERLGGVVNHGLFELTEAGGGMRPNNWSVTGLFLVVLALVAVCAGFGAQDKSTANQDVEGLYRQQCATCHDGALALMAAENIRFALTNGSMKSQGDHLLTGTCAPVHASEANLALLSSSACPSSALPECPAFGLR